MTRNRANLSGIIPGYYPISEFNYKHLKNDKKLFSVYDDNIFPFLRECSVFSLENFKIISNFRPITKNVTHNETRQQSW